MSRDSSSRRVAAPDPVVSEGADGTGEADLPPATPKRRACLRCETSFESAWAGERICARCKGSVAWREGVPYNPVPSDRRR